MARKPSKPKTRRSSSRKAGGASPAATRAPRGRVTPVETAYQRRIRQYLEAHPGATRAQARGHRPAEHATREARARERGKLTEKERAAIKRFAIRNAKRRGIDGDLTSDEIYRDMVEWFGAKGFDQFEALRAQVDQLHRRGSSGVRMKINKKTGEATLVGDLNLRSQNQGLMEAFSTRYGLPDIQWLFYH